MGKKIHIKCIAGQNKGKYLKGITRVGRATFTTKKSYAKSYDNIDMLHYDIDFLSKTYPGSIFMYE